MATSKNQVATAANTAVSAQDAVPDYIKQGMARGSENVGAEDMAIPRLEIVQAQSPIKDENPDAREGMFFNSVTQELYPDVVHFVPVFFRVEFIVWKDQDHGGGFFGSFPTEEQAKLRVAEAVKDGEDSDLLEIVDTPVHFGLLVDPDQPGKMSQIVISMAKSKAKVSRKWNSMIQIVGGDRFSRCYKIGTFTDENKQGKKFKNFVVSPAGYAPEFAYREGEKLYEALRGGTMDIKAAHGSVSEGEDATGTARGEV